VDPERAVPESSGTPPDRGSTAPSSRSGAPGAYAAARRHRWLLGPALLLLAVVVVRAFLVTPFGIPSQSMQDTLLIGDRILVDRTTAPADLQRGDIVVFDASQAFDLQVPERGIVQTLVEAVESLAGKGQPTDYVKRVIGLPGDHVRCCAPDGRLEVNGVALTEPYVAPGQSADSRAHLGDPGGGMVPGDDIIGKVWVRYWPLGRLGSVDQGQVASVPRNGE